MLLSYGAVVSVCKFLQQTGTRRRNQEIKCEAGGALAGQEMTLRSMGNRMDGQIKNKTQCVRVRQRQTN